MTIEQQQDNTEHRQSPGLILKMAREKRGLSQSDVANRLNLRLALVRDIEQDRFDQKTASTFTRGYLKTYAKFVGANEQDVLTAYDRLGLKETKYTEMHSFSGRTRREASEHRMRFISWFLCLGLIAAGATWWWLQPTEEPVPTTINEAGQLVVKSPAEVTSNEVAANDQGTAPVQESSTENTEQEPADTVAQTAVGNEDQPSSIISEDATENDDMSQEVVAPSSAESTMQAAADEPVNTETANKDTQTQIDANIALQVQFTAQCWLKITDASGKSLFEGTKNAGDKLELSGAEPFSLIIGAPRAVSVYFHGQQVDMSSYVKRGVVARYKLPLKN